MNSAARRLYARDGSVLLDIDDLVGWAVDHYMANRKNKSKAAGTMNDGREPEGEQEDTATDNSEQLQYGGSQQLSYKSI